MKTWIANGEPVYTRDDMPDYAIGFIYEITYTNGKKYIGKKDLFSYKTLPPLVGQKRKRKVKIESKWKTYSGSTKLSKGLVIQSREIIFYAETKRALTYLEVRELFRRDVIFNGKYLNENIGGKYFNNVFDKLKEK